MLNGGKHADRRETKREKERAYLVGIREVHVATVRVMAARPDEALHLVRERGLDAGEELAHEYSHTLDPSTWSIEPEHVDNETVPEVPLESIKKIIAYDYDAEKEHYAQHPTENHIFTHIERVRKWLSTQEKTT